MAQVKDLLTYTLGGEKIIKNVAQYNAGVKMKRYDLNKQVYHIPGLAFTHLKRKSKPSLPEEAFNELYRQLNEALGLGIDHYIIVDQVSNPIFSSKLESKPDKKSLTAINNRLAHINKKIIVTPDFLLKIATVDKYTFVPAVFKKGSRSNYNFISQSVFALDFDSGITVDQVYKRFKSIGITPNLFYYTFSDSPELRKFRVVLFLDQVVDDRLIRDNIQKSLMKLFDSSKGADKACKDAVRLYFPGNHGEVSNKCDIDYDKLISALEVNNIANDGLKTRSMNKTPLRAKTQNVVKKQNSYMYNIEVREINHKNEYPQIIEKFDFDKAAAEVIILRDFMNLEWLTYMQLRGLALNLQYVEGGLKFMKNTMEKFNEVNEGKVLNGEQVYYNANAFALLVNVRARQGTTDQYMPERLSEFSPHDEDHKYHNLLSIHDERGKIEIIDKTKHQNKMTLKEAEQKLKEGFAKAISEDSNYVYILKTAPGLGKSEEAANIKVPVLMAAPTHKLKDELSIRAMNKDMSEHVHIIPELKFQTPGLAEKILFYYSLGLQKEVYKLISEVKSSAIYFDEDKYLIDQYFNILNKAKKTTTEKVFTTHQKAIYDDNFKLDTLIFDEDPLNSIFQIKELKITDLHKIRMLKGIDSELLAQLNRVIEQFETLDTYYMKTKTYNINLKKLVDLVVNTSGVESNILDFFNSKWFIRDLKDQNIIHYINYNPLPENKKVIIMSATAPIAIYKKFLGDRLKVIDISNVEQIGEVIQHTKKSYSRNSLSKNIAAIVEEVNDLACITFATFKHKFKNPVENMHFGNCAGYDELKGKDIAIVGTPHISNHKYFLLGLAMGIELKTIDNCFEYQKIEWNGYRFKFNTFLNDDLREIQLSLIESELIQAAGRNRTVRENCKTHIYSNLPIDFTTRFQLN